MTERERASEPDRRTMGDMCHVHPDTRETFGAVYRRGPAIADGGEAPARARTDSSSASEGSEDDTGGGGDTVADVDHEGPEPEANDVWSRGPEDGRMNDTGDGHDAAGDASR